MNEQQIKQNISKAFKRCRIEKKLTQEGLGFEIGLQRRGTSRIETGDTACSLVTWLQFCEFSGYDLDEAFIGRINFKQEGGV